MPIQAWPHQSHAGFGPLFARGANGIHIENQGILILEIPLDPVGTGIEAQGVADQAVFPR